MHIRALKVLTRKELNDAFRNRWFILYGVSFALLSLAFSAASLLGSGQYGFANFGRTAASLINLVLLVVPLMGLTAGAMGLSSEKERGTLAYLLAQPVSRRDVFLGKFLGQAIALSVALTAGFGFCMIVLWWHRASEQVTVLLALLALSILLSTASLSIGMLLSTFARGSSAALGTAVFLWLALAFGADLGLMGIAFVRNLDIRTLFHLAIINPLSVFRMAAVLSMRSNLEILGPAGMYAVQTYGNALLPFFAAALLAWTAVPLTCALRVFNTRDAV